MNEAVEEPHKRLKPNREKVSYTLKPLTDDLIRKWAGEDQESQGRIIDDVVAFAVRKGFRDDV